MTTIFNQPRRSGNTTKLKQHVDKHTVVFDFFQRENLWNTKLVYDDITHDIGNASVICVDDVEKWKLSDAGIHDLRQKWSKCSIYITGQNINKAWNK